MAKEHRPHRGSMAFRPRKRSETQTPRVTAWPASGDVQLLGFAGYKAGMTHVFNIEEGRSHLKGVETFVPVTVVESPPIIVYAIRFYKDGRVVRDYITDSKDALLRLKFKKRATEPGAADAQKMPEAFDDVTVLIFTQPHLTKMGKKKAERMEIAIGGDEPAKKLDYAKSILGKEIRASDVLKPGEVIDTIAITKGKGWQGVVKRFGHPIHSRKATGKRRHGGVLGTFNPGYVMWTVPRAGQTGYHKRSEFNKTVIKIGAVEENITPSGGFVNYGVVRNDYILVKGSLPGPKRRLIRLRKAIRTKEKTKPVNVTFVSLESQMK